MLEAAGVCNSDAPAGGMAARALSASGGSVPAAAICSISARLGAVCPSRCPDASSCCMLPFCMLACACSAACAWWLSCACWLASCSSVRLRRRWLWL